MCGPFVPDQFAITKGTEVEVQGASGSLNRRGAEVGGFAITLCVGPSCGIKRAWLDVFVRFAITWWANSGRASDHERHVDATI
jgi:hypothetical protein